MRNIEELYDSRYSHDILDLRQENGASAGAPASGKSDRLSSLFPVFAVDFYSRRLGLRKLVDQTCWDLLFNVHAMRKESLEVEVFARFLAREKWRARLLPFCCLRTWSVVFFCLLSRAYCCLPRQRQEEYYDPDDLLFFLYVRSVIQKELGVNFRARWSELGRGKERVPAPVLLTYRECNLVSRVVFGADAQPLYSAFLRLVERHMVGSHARGGPGRPGHV